MKKILPLLLMIGLLFWGGLVATPALAQNRVFEKYSDMDDVAYICITKQMLKFMDNISNPSVTVNNVKLTDIQNIDVVLIINTDNAKVGEQMKADFQALKSDKHYQMVTYVKDNESMAITLMDDNDDMNELITYVEDEDEQTFVVITGHLTREMMKAIFSNK